MKLSFVSRLQVDEHEEMARMKVKTRKSDQRGGNLAKVRQEAVVAKTFPEIGITCSLLKFRGSLQDFYSRPKRSIKQTWPTT